VLDFLEPNQPQASSGPAMASIRVRGCNQTDYSAIVAKHGADVKADGDNP
jgi:hypothetical protein